MKNEIKLSCGFMFKILFVSKVVADIHCLGITMKPSSLDT